MGLELERSLPGGIKSSWTYSNDGMPESHVVRNSHGDTRRRYYHWDANQRLKLIMNGITGGSIKFGNDVFDNLAWAQYEDGQFDYRQPDKVGNLYKTQDRKDRKYGPGGRLLETSDARYLYDDEGYLIKKVVMTAPAGNTIWEYEWYGNGMLKKVIRPDGRTVDFRFDALGRRIEKQYNGQLTRFLWDGHVPLHEWCYPVAERPMPTVDEFGEVLQNHPEPVPTETLVTWVYEDNTFVPAAKLINGRRYSIISDYLGTPCEAYDEAGEKIWECELDIYGKVRKFVGENNFVPFRYQGQYEDLETGLYYNRYRYYSPDEGRYISQDPIGLGGGLRMYAYVNNPSVFTDVLGLWGDEGFMNGAKATASIVNKNENGQWIKGPSVTEVSDPSIAHAEIRALNQLANENNLRGMDIEIHDVVGDFSKKGELPVGICSDCRTDMFAILIDNEANSVTMPVTINKKPRGTLTIPAENFAAVRAELITIRNSIPHDSPRSKAAWEILKKYSVCR